ncbi:hypothetical protein [Streptomyces niveus]|uniref:hypothetical protein n=1 Tax=Streptomyces niveus TaxID=193462 RepID=UPI0033F7A784
MGLATHKAGRHGISLRRGRLEDAVVEALLTHGDDNTAMSLHGDRISPEMRRRIAEHPDPAIRDAHTGFVRDMVERKVPSASVVWRKPTASLGAHSSARRVRACAPRSREPGTTGLSPCKWNYSPTRIRRSVQPANSALRQTQMYRILTAAGR